VLPVYAFWHFDDFSWGETRKVAGEGKDLGHVGDGGSPIEVNAVPLRRWEDWERSRLRKLKRDDRRRRELARGYASSQATSPDFRNSNRWDAETASLATTQDDDRYGMQIGHYNEEALAHSLPPVGLYAVDDGSSVTLQSDQMAAILDEGWDEEEEEHLEDDRAVMSQAVSYTPHRPPANPVRS
jgi:chitin synthase